MSTSAGQVDRVADRLIGDLVGGHLDGLEVVPSQVLPIRPSLGEWCRRYTRHQWGTELLAWLGEDIGPAPDDVTHVVYAHDGVEDRLMVSPEVYEQLRDVLALVRT